VASATHADVEEVGSMTERNTVASDPGEVMLQARNVKFDWTDLPMHWVPGDPYTTHVLNVLHLILPAGEHWFVDTFKEALPYIDDEKLRDDVIGFIGQEAVHAEAHTGVLVHLQTKGLDPTPFTDQMEWAFGKVLGSDSVTSLRSKNNLVERLALIAAIEHVTAFLGDWVLNSIARAFTPPCSICCAGTVPKKSSTARSHTTRSVTSTSARSVACAPSWWSCR
jgi:predicted metal-dependent hydrolase